MADKITYALRSIDIGKLRQVEISEAEFVEIRDANRGLVVVLGLEEKLEYVLANFAEYESELLRLALDRVIWGDQGWTSDRKARHVVNRRLMNLLSSGRLYIDQAMHDVSAIAGEGSPASAEVKKAMSQEYDAQLGYRVMEAFRNHVQHRDVPVHHLTFPFVLNADVDPMTLTYSAVPLLDVRRLAADGKFKKAILNELVSQGDTVPLTPLVRGYVAGITRVHAVIRRETDAKVRVWDNMIAAASKRAKELFTEETHEIMLIAEYPGEHIVRRYNFDEVWRERRELRRRNRTFKNLEESFVVGESPRTVSHDARAAG